jgi:hypothetical protein
MKMPVGRTYVVLFDIADQQFTHYTRDAWVAQINEWAEELKQSGYVIGKDRGLYRPAVWEEIVETMGDNEWFVTFIED